WRDALLGSLKAFAEAPIAETILNEDVPF
ncbi:MAG: hypothetical protein JWN34_1628, partial [Bryobacterales bacterium]|nr:hypothetical protein [Bryobacterales bacterium]